MHEFIQRINQADIFKGLQENISADNQPYQLPRMTTLLKAIFLNTLAGDTRNLLIITPSKDEGLAYYEMLAIFSNNLEMLPHYVGSPYKASGAWSEELIPALTRLKEPTGRIFIAYANDIMIPVASPYVLNAYSSKLKNGDVLDRDELVGRCLEQGYYRVDLVAEPGDIAVRGGIVDIFQLETENPVRIEFFDDEIVSIRYFDANNQRSINEIDSLVLNARNSYPIPTTTRETIRDNIAARFTAKEAAFLDEKFFTTLDKEKTIVGIAPIVYGAKYSLISHLASGSIILLEEPEAIRQTIEEISNTAHQYYSERAADNILSPDELFCNWKEIGEFSKHHKLLESSLIANREIVFHTENAISGSTEEIVERVQEFAHLGYEIWLFCENIALRNKVSLALDFGHIAAKVMLGNLEDCLIIHEGRIAVLAARKHPTRVARALIQRKKIRTGMPNVQDFNVGDYVVHDVHGIGIYRGIRKIEVLGKQHDCLLIEYSEGDKVFVPIPQIASVEKYLAKEGLQPRIDKLGSGNWLKVKTKVKRALIDIAGELLDIYAARASLPGIEHPPEDEYSRMLTESFPYQETPDQQKAIEAIIDNMEATYPMDRLICGDVGYGKTEVAIRAAFKAINGGRQVAVLVPTTILAFQHYETFNTRLSELPVTVEMISRFRSKKEQTQIIQQLSAGEIDVLIGTHRLFSDDVKFKDLGLLIIDEEHRFGVRHKEKLRKMRATIDVLSLSATPIPRTLQMALTGARDLSLITTPPRDRRPIITEIRPFSPLLISEAIQYEIDRGGQVFFVHNRIESIYRLGEYLGELLPHVTFRVAHGQMPEDHLENVMVDFYHHRFDVLVSTMIIESGLDIPNVNTLIVNRADRLGLAQLYQLRGRVGRSHHQAYAYLLIPSKRKLTPTARKRLDVIEAHTGLGSGYQIAMRDLEMRGAGNVLGAQQHGFITSVGFEMYCRMLEDAISDTRGISKTVQKNAEIQLPIDAYLPDDYVDTPLLKVDIYRRLGRASSSADVLDLREELEDRFGIPPIPTDNLLKLRMLALKGGACGIEKLQYGSNKIKIDFSQDAPVMIKKLEPVLEDYGDKVQLNSDVGKFRVVISVDSANDALSTAEHVLDSIPVNN